MIQISLIYARSENYCIGRDGGLPWSLPDEFAHFNQTTMGHAIIMGRLSYEDHAYELPGRLNIVITRNADYELAPGVLRAPSLTGAIDLAVNRCGHAFVIGGTRYLREALPLADLVYETIVHAEIPGDTFVDPFDFSGWGSELLANHAIDAEHAHAFSIYRHLRTGIPPGQDA